MSRQVFVNLPARELSVSVAFFTGPGFRFDPRFSDDNATWMVVADGIRVMLQVEPFVQTFTEGLLTYATGRKLEHYDMPTVRRIVRGAAGSQYRFSSIVQAVVRSEQFRMRRAPQPAPVGEATKVARGNQ